MDRRILALGLGVALLGACAPKRVHEEPVLENGDRTPSADAVAAQAGAGQTQTQAAIANRRDEMTADALADCEPSVCEAVARGEVALGMTTKQVLAATRTTEDAWSIRSSGPATVLVPALRTGEPKDAVGLVSLVQLRDGRVASYAYRESQGIRVVNAPEDATTEGRASAMAEQLLREGDDFTARGDLGSALDRYDRADILRPNDPMTTYRIATTLDKQLRPYEALIRYQLFLHQMELETIQAQGEAYANIAQAIAYAKERVIVLDKRGN